VKYLVVPRLIATLAVMPILTIYTDLVGIFGGFIVSVTKLGINPQNFVHSVLESLVLKDLLSGLFKSAIFGVLVCVVSCHEGLRTRGGAEGVGRSTMQAVVASFITIVLADFFFTLLFYIVQF
jgi:phospholipid/cholesterol/gamma-HCH transport system permease protein